VKLLRALKLHEKRRKQWKEAEERRKQGKGTEEQEEEPPLSEPNCASMLCLTTHHCCASPLCHTVTVEESIKLTQDLCDWWGYSSITKGLLSR